MNWEAFWDEQSAASDAAAQVGRIQAIKQPQLNQRITDHIAEQLQLQTNDKLLDVCCGNGTLSALLKAHCQLVLGVDFSDQLIAIAKNSHQTEGLHFVRANALHLSGLGGKFHKINLYFAFQYFESYEAGLRVLAEMNSLLLPGGQIFIGDTPDQRRWFTYYNSPIKWLRYLFQRAKGTENMGKFWHPKEFEAMAKALGLQLKMIDQPADLPHARYRFDALFTKPAA